MGDNRKGKKNARGFYDYATKLKKGKKRQVDESVYSTLGISAQEKYPLADIAERCVVQLLNEAVQCLDEGIIASARDGDIGAIFGIGFAPFLGGPFRYMDSMGLTTLVTKLRSYEAKYGERFTPCAKLVEMAEKGETFY